MVEVEEPAGRNSTSVEVAVLVTRAVGIVSGFRGARGAMSEHTSAVTLGMGDGRHASQEAGDEGASTHVGAEFAVVE